MSRDEEWAEVGRRWAEFREVLLDAIAPLLQPVIRAVALVAAIRPKRKRR